MSHTFSDNDCADASHKSGSLKFHNPFFRGHDPGELLLLGDEYRTVEIRAETDPALLDTSSVPVASERKFTAYLRWNAYRAVVSQQMWVMSPATVTDETARSCSHCPRPVPVKLPGMFFSTMISAWRLLISSWSSQARVPLRNVTDSGAGLCAGLRPWESVLHGPSPLPGGCFKTSGRLTGNFPGNIRSGHQ